MYNRLLVVSEPVREIDRLMSSINLVSGKPISVAIRAAINTFSLLLSHLPFRTRSSFVYFPVVLHHVLLGRHVARSSRVILSKLARVVQRSYHRWLQVSGGYGHQLIEALKTFKLRRGVSTKDRKLVDKLIPTFVPLQDLETTIEMIKSLMSVQNKEVDYVQM